MPEYLQGFETLKNRFKNQRVIKAMLFRYDLLTERGNMPAFIKPSDEPASYGNGSS